MRPSPPIAPLPPQVPRLALALAESDRAQREGAIRRSSRLRVGKQVEEELVVVVVVVVEEGEEEEEKKKKKER
jgi:hypothetical protein